MDELKGMASLVLGWRSLAMIPLMLYTNWCYAYQQQIFNGVAFDYPTAGLNSSFYWLAQCIASVLLGLVTDAPGVSQRKRALRSVTVVGIVVGASWIFGLYMNQTLQIECDGNGSFWNQQKCRVSNPIRFGTSAWVSPVLLYTWWGVSDSLAQIWCMWILGQFSDDPIIASRYAGIYKCF